jgi:hypothetical protein
MDPVDELTTTIATVTITDPINTGTISTPKSGPRRVPQRNTASSATATNTGTAQPVLGEIVISMRAELLQIQTQTNKSVDKILERLAELGKTQEKLKRTELLLEEAKAQCTRQEKELCQTRADLKNAQNDAQELLQRQLPQETGHSIQFREYKVDSESGCTKFDFVRTFVQTFVQTFSVRPKYNYTVMAYVMFDGKPYYSQSGQHPATPDGIISGMDYSQKACELFQLLGYDPPSISYFQHAEPQLMALYVEKFRNGDLTFEKFRDLRTSSLGKLLKVEILVSRPPCWHCELLMKRVNVKAENHGFEFVLEDVSLE